MEEKKSLHHPRPIKKTKTAALENATAADGRVCSHGTGVNKHASPHLLLVIATSFWEYYSYPTDRQR